MFNTLFINIPFVKDPLKMLGYAKFMKKLVTKKRNMDFKTIEVSHHFSAIMSNNLVIKKKDMGAFKILCTIGVFFAKALYDLGSSKNLMSLAIFKQLGLAIPSSTTMRLHIVDRTIKTWEFSMMYW